jgi:5'-nucleotidase
MFAAAVVSRAPARRVGIGYLFGMSAPWSRARHWSWLALASWLGSATQAAAEPAADVHLRLLGMNDFHGQLEAGRRFQDRPVGGAAVLAAYLRASAAAFAGPSFIVHAGDWVGASPPSSALLQDEPSIGWLNLLANEFCTYERRDDPRCNLAAAPGNHEFDEGADELLRLVQGGASKSGDFLEQPYRGARFPYVCANVTLRASGKPLLPPYVIKQAGALRFAIIGAVTEDAPNLVVKSGVRGLRFSDAADAINRQVRLLKKQGIEAIVVSVHKGGAQEPYAGPTRADVAGPSEGITDFMRRLDSAVDVVISGHAHAFSNALVRNARGHSILLTQAGSAGSAFAEIDLTLDAKTGDVTAKSASIIATFADAGPGLTPAKDVAQLVAAAQARVAALTSRVVASLPAALVDTPNAAGESALGNLIADAQRAAMHADVALMNQGGIRTSLAAGPQTWGALFAVQPFSNTLIAMELSGAQLLRALEQQWQETPARLLQVSGLRYVWDPARPPGARVREVLVAGRPLQAKARYRVVVNSFLASGGGGFDVFTQGTRRETGPVDLDALIDYLKANDGRLSPHIEGRARVP